MKCLRVQTASRRLFIKAVKTLAKTFILLQHFKIQWN